MGNNCRTKVHHLQNQTLITTTDGMRTTPVTDLEKITLLEPMGDIRDCRVQKTGKKNLKG